MRQETEAHFLVCTVILGFLSIFKKSQASSPYETLNSVCLWRGQRDVRPPVQMRQKLKLSIGSPQGIQTCLHLVIWKMSLNLSHFREIGPSFESGPLGVHSTWSRKHSVPLTSLLLTENSSWGACGNLAHLFTQRQGINSHLGTIWGAWSFPRVAVLKLIFIYTWEWCLS